MPIRRQPVLAAAASLLLAAAAGASPIQPAAFTPARVVENFEGIGAGANVGTSAYANILLPASTSTYTFASGVSILGPNPGLFANGAFLHETNVAGAVNTWGTNGTVATAADVPDPWGQASSEYIGAFDSLGAGSAMLDFYFASDMHRVGAWVAGAAGSTITVETYDATNTLLETLTIAAPSVASWSTSFLGIGRSEGIRRVVFRGADFGLDGLTFDATPLPEPRVGLLLLCALFVAFWRGRD